MGNEEKILNDILQNTEELKKVVIKTKKEVGNIEGKTEQKELTPQQKALKKFKKVSAQLNEAEQERFKAILETNNTNANAFIKKKIFEDNSTDLEIFKNEIQDLKNENMNLKNDNSTKENTINKKNQEIETLKAKIKDFEEQFEEFREANVFKVIWAKLRG